MVVHLPGIAHTVKKDRTVCCDHRNPVMGLGVHTFQISRACELNSCANIGRFRCDLLLDCPEKILIGG
ncbi:hypothetical protein SDC9_100905 [bioreactor metagenome]|uniref:Uncharacterized protein n=1 Tax=bioreactor metagenome TaxID=1076179 RepID=A0A645ALM0_9ZZZZ